MPETMLIHALLQMRIIGLLFIDDMLIVCCEPAMQNIKKHFTDMVDCDDIGEMKEYIGARIDIDLNNKSLEITQPVLVKILMDELPLVNLMQG